MHGKTSRKQTVYWILPVKVTDECDLPTVTMNSPQIVLAGMCAAAK